MRIGTPTGSSAYHDVDPEETVYGDIDLKIIVPDLPELQNATQATMQGWWYRQEAEYVASANTGVHPDSSAGHPILNVGKDQWVQVDMMIHPEPLANWGAARVIPERGIKGVISSTVYSSLAEVLNLRISTNGVQAKLRNGEPVSFRQSKDTELRTVSLDPDNWAKDIYSLYYYLANGTKPSEFTSNLNAHSGHRGETRLSDIVLSIKALAEALEEANLLGHGALIAIPNKQDLIRKVATVYSNKLETAENSSKFDKAQTPAAIEKAKKTKLMLAKYRNEITKLLLN